MDFDSTPVHSFGIFPIEVLVEQFLLAGTVHQVLSPDDVGHPQFVVIYGALEV